MSINNLIQDFTRSMRNEGYNVEVVISKAKKEAPQIKVGDFVKCSMGHLPNSYIYGTVEHLEQREGKTTYVWLADGIGYPNFELSKEPV